MIGCLCIHGFTGDTWEVEPIADYLKKETDWVIVTPTLPGHGPSSNLKGYTKQDWIEEAITAYKKLEEQVDEIIVVGFSMGGMIASYLAAHYSVKKLVLLSAAAYYVNPSQFAVDIKQMFEDALNRNLKDNELFNRYKKKIIETPLSSTLEFQKLVREVRPLLEKIHQPTLIIQGEEDGIVPAKSAHFLYDQIGSKEKELCFLPSSKHHVCHGNDFDTLKKKVHEFLISGE
ncbi:alpha/beta fold hydrolase [Bacillus carboniphilus]|uniref:Alpha/beta fold hydrolase n=1 Tax=Bacillus carboniphilus TaxID=86663 RepID=A0ABY9JRV6_9BACI|nr:alpha/beta fold hydrolase [Bacillus carboniphilus]WLR42141.1 alpha/beta fold hydrolase [Bacillus carboniphilus]